MDVNSVVEVKPNPKIDEFRPGDSVKVSFRVVEGEKERVQVFNGVVIRQRGIGISKTFTVRQMFHGIGVERIFPFNSPLLEKVELVAHGNVRRAKLYFIRGLSRKKTRLKLKSRQ